MISENSLLLSIKKEYNLTDVQTPFIPVGVGIGVFVAGLIVCNIFGGALDEYLPAPEYESELTNEEEIVLIEDIRDYAYSHNFGYSLRHEGEWLFEVNYNGFMHRYTINVYDEGKFLLPIFTMGKFFERGGKCFLPLAVQIIRKIE